MTRPIIIVQKPTVKVWTAPPIVKTTAPMNRVPFRPIMSPTLPAATEVTFRLLSRLCTYRDSKLTECTNFQDSNHSPKLYWSWTTKVLLEMRASDNPAHDTVLQSAQTNQRALRPRLPLVISKLQDYQSENACGQL